MIRLYPDGSAARASRAKGADLERFAAREMRERRRRAFEERLFAENMAQLGERCRRPGRA